MKKFLRKTWIVITHLPKSVYFVLALMLIFGTVTYLAIDEWNEYERPQTEYEVVGYGEIISYKKINNVWDIELKTDKQIIKTSVKNLKDVSEIVNKIQDGAMFYVLQTDDTRYLSNVYSKELVEKLREDEYNEDLILYLLMTALFCLLSLGCFFKIVEKIIKTALESKYLF